MCLIYIYIYIHETNVPHNSGPLQAGGFPFGFLLMPSKKGATASVSGGGTTDSSGFLARCDGQEVFESGSVKP